jgi:hypothetical protein
MGQPVYLGLAGRVAGDPLGTIMFFLKKNLNLNLLLLANSVTVKTQKKKKQKNPNFFSFFFLLPLPVPWASISWVALWTTSATLCHSPSTPMSIRAKSPSPATLLASSARTPTRTAQASPPSRS